MRASVVALLLAAARRRAGRRPSSAGHRSGPARQHARGATSGRSAAAAPRPWPALPSQPNVFYIGVVNGGVWKTTDAGRTWSADLRRPADRIDRRDRRSRRPTRTSSTSAAAKGMQRPDLSTGDGIYKSTDAGRTWTHLGLRDGQQIPQIVVDPRDPNRLFVAVLGHPYGPNAERGIFRSHRRRPDVRAGALQGREHRRRRPRVRPGRPEHGLRRRCGKRGRARGRTRAWTGPGSGLFKSTDGGTTWRPLTTGLADVSPRASGRIGITVAPSRSQPPVRRRGRRPRRRHLPIGRRRRDLVARERRPARHRAAERRRRRARRIRRTRTSSTCRRIVAWKSTDGGKTFTALRGAPGGDDYQKIWINPDRPDVMIMTADQGASSRVNGGETWSSWYNQPTAQFYHVSTDNAFPYRVCGGQQESGSACVASRGDHGQITFRDWTPVGVEEYGYVAPDPLDPDIVYGGKVTRFDRRTGQVQNVAPPRGADYRVLRTAPVALLADRSAHAVLRVEHAVEDDDRRADLDGDQSRPDARDLGGAGERRRLSLGRRRAQPTRRGVIYTSRRRRSIRAVIWAGTDDGLIHVTRDGGTTWTNVTPPALVPWAKVSIIEASHFDTEHGLRGDQHAAARRPAAAHLPHARRRQDVDGDRRAALPAGGADQRRARGPAAPRPALRRQRAGRVRVVRRRRALAVAAAQHAGDVDSRPGDQGRGSRRRHARPRLLDSRRHHAAAADHAGRRCGRRRYLFRPPTAWRFRWNKNTDTPLPPDEPAAPNPPDGVVISYLLGGGRARAR